MKDFNFCGIIHSTLVNKLNWLLKLQFMKENPYLTNITIILIAWFQQQLWTYNELDSGFIPDYTLVRFVHISAFPLKKNELYKFIPDCNLVRFVHISAFPPKKNEIYKLAQWFLLGATKCRLHHIVTYSV